MFTILYLIKSYHPHIPNRMVLVISSSRNIYDYTRDNCDLIRNLLMFSSEVYKFEKNVFIGCIKSRYNNLDDINIKFKQKTLEEIVNQLHDYNVAFYVNNRITDIGLYSKPYPVITSLVEFYNELNMEN